MRFVLSLLVAGIAWIGTTRGGDEPDEPDPRAIVAKAIKAMGGAEILKKAAAIRVRYEAGQEPPWMYDAPKTKGELHFQQHDGVSKFRHAADGQLSGFDGRAAWYKDGGANRKIFEARPELLRLDCWMEVLRWQNLTPLLTDKSYKLTSLGELWEKGTVSSGVKVSMNGRSSDRRSRVSAELYFDKNNGLLVKAKIRAPGVVLVEAHFRDYGELTAADEKRLKNAKRGVKGPDLIQALRTSIPDGTSQKEIEALVEQLGDKRYAVREKALAALKHQGLKAAGVLNRAAATADLERSRRIEKCLSHLTQEIELAAAAVRLIGARRPAGATQVLLDFLLWTPSEGLAREAEDALVALAGAEKDSPALKAALKSENVRVRKAAAAALGQAKNPDKRPGRRLYLEGLRVPHRIIIFQEGQQVEIDVIATDFFNRFDDALFERPREHDRKK